jgi:putative nucleotidyltransferase with HDIG domain
VVSHFNEDLWYGTDTRDEGAVEAKAARSLAAKVGRIVGAKPFPAAAQKLSELTRDTDCRMEPVVKVLESDPALSVKLLRLVNSAGFALRMPCTSVSHAASLVGVRRLHQLAQTAAVLDLVDANSEAAAKVMEHASVVAALCRYLAGHVGLPAEELFTCGFLHDIGKVMLLESEGDSYRALVEETAGEPDNSHVRERELLGYDHAVLGGQVLSAWNIPAPIPRVVAWHHQVARAYEENTALARTINTLRLADAAATALFNPQPEFGVERLARTEAASYLDISEAQIAAMWDEMLAVAVRARASYRGESIPDVEPQVQTSQAPGSRRKPFSPPPLEEAPEAPCNFPCVACGIPTYANVCRACGGYVCPEHHQNDDEWCSLCVDRYERLRLNFPPWAYSVLGGAVGAMLVGTVLGSSGGLGGQPLAMVVAPGLISLLVLVMAGVWHRWLRRMWFLRSSPNRRSLAPPVSETSRAMSKMLSSAGPLSKAWVNPFEGNLDAPIIRDKPSPEPGPVRELSERPRRGESLVSLRPSMHVEGSAARGPFDRLVKSSQVPTSRSRNPQPTREPLESDFPPPSATIPRRSAAPAAAAAATPSITPSVDAFDDPVEAKG